MIVWIWGLQMRLQRCAESCNDSHCPRRPTGDAADMAKAQKIADVCGNKCCEDTIGSLPRLEGRITEQLSKV